LHTRLCVLTTHPHPRSTLFPYTTLFRSKIALTTPVMVITGMPANLKREIGEFSKISFRRHGRMAAATTVPRKVMAITPVAQRKRSEEHTSELQSRFDLVCRLLLEKKNYN